MEFPSELEISMRILLALALGGLIGLEREISDHPAGLRTHIGVALGAALFGIASAYGFQEFNASRTDTNFQVDPTRVASNIVVGVGFLGGGAILKHGATVRGLTTAASLWVTAAIGTAVALGSYVPALVTTAAMLTTLVLLRGPRRALKARFRSRETVIIRLRGESDSKEVIKALGDLEGITVRSLTVRDIEDQCVVQADVVGEKGEDLETKLAPLADLEGVDEVDVT